MRRLKPVPQKNENGCGVSAVACVLGRNYAAALRLFAPNDGNDTTRGFSRSALIKALKKGGRTYVHRRFGTLEPGERWAAVTPGSIVCVRSVLPDWKGWFVHYLVRTPAGWIDGTDSDWKKATGRRAGQKPKGRRDEWQAARTGRERKRLPGHYRAMSYLKPAAS